MRGFSFRLEPLLNLRRHREEEFQVRLAASLRALDLETGRLETLRLQLRECVLRLARDQGKGPLDMEKVTREEDYLAALEQRLEGQEALVARLTQQVAREREELVQASREKKTLERLRESLLLAYIREETRREAKSAEEVATSRHLRRQREEGFADGNGG